MNKANGVVIDIYDESMVLHETTLVIGFLIIGLHNKDYFVLLS